MNRSYSSCTLAHQCSFHSTSGGLPFSADGVTTFHGSLVPLKRTPNGLDSLSRTATRRKSFSAVIDSNFLGSASGYQDDSDASDDEEEAIAVGEESTSGFGRHGRAERTWIQKHEKSSNFMTCFLSRMYNAHTKCFMLLALSCVLLATGVPRSTWSLLLSQGIVYKREAIEQTLLDIGKECME